MSFIEKPFAQQVESCDFVLSAHKYRNVVVAAAIRNHAYRYLLECIYSLCLEATVLPLQVAYYAYDYHIFVDSHCAEFLQLVGNLIEMLTVVDGDRHADLRCRYHVDRSLVVFEYFEHLTQESGSQQHTAALDPKTAAKVLALSDKIISENNLTAMMVTHNMKDAIAHGNRLIMMHEGRVIYDISGEEKKNLKVSDLLAKFEEVSGGEFANDRMMLS